ncbi:MAG: acyl-CoA/acyl-ACP dehydrogenase, partial [Rhodospirillaceae bacterium]|nr:acyl-CoA/acyl-ACP dehydrogenase [Rhodospirillaceae bacterium]
IPEEYGGSGMGHLELCVLAEELGRALAPTPFASSIYLGAEALLTAGSEEQKRSYLPDLATGAAIWCLALSEGARPATEGNIAATVSDGKLTGEKLPVADGDAADRAIVVAREGATVNLYIVDLNGDGVTRRVVDTMDPTRSQARLSFANAPAEKLGEEGWPLLERIQDRAAVLIAFEQIGGAQACLEMAKEYALGRFAFGRAIAGYQAIKHRLADMYIQIELARSNAYYGAWALSTNAAELPVAAATARVAAIEAYNFATKENVQVHGGMGFTWEFNCHLYYRRARQLALVLGSQRRWKDRLIRALERRNAA